MTCRSVKVFHFLLWHLLNWNNQVSPFSCSSSNEETTKNLWRNLYTEFTNLTWEKQPFSKRPANWSQVQIPVTPVIKAESPLELCKVNFPITLCIRGVTHSNTCSVKSRFLDPLNLHFYSSFLSKYKYLSTALTTPVLHTSFNLFTKARAKIAKIFLMSRR